MPNNKIRNIGIADSALIDIRDRAICSTPLIDYIKLILKELQVSFKDSGPCGETNCTSICSPEVEMTYDEGEKILCITIGDTEQCIQLDITNTISTLDCEGVVLTGTGSDLDPLKACLVIDPDECNLITLSEAGLKASVGVTGGYEDGILTIQVGCSEPLTANLTEIYSFQHALTPTGTVIEWGGEMLHDTNLTEDFDIGIPDGRLAVGYNSPFATSDFKFAVSNSSTSINNSAIIVNSQPIKNTTDTTGILVNRILNGAAFVQSSSSGAYGLLSNLEISVTGNNTFLDSSNSAIRGNLELNTTGALTITAPILSAITASVNAIEESNYGKIANLYISPITSLAGQPFSGLIEEYAGIYIDTLGRDKLLEVGELTRTYGIKQVGDVTNWFQGVVNINVSEDIEAPVFDSIFPLPQDRPRLSVGKASTFSNAAIDVTTNSELSMFGDGNPASFSTSVYSAVNGTFGYFYEEDKTLNPAFIFSGVTGSLNIVTDTDISDGIISAVASNINFASATEDTTAGTIDWVTGFRATVIKQLQYQATFNQFFDTVHNAVGVMIDAQDEVPEFTVDNTWGVYQKGINDVNYFAGSTGVGTSTPDAKVMFEVASTIKGSIFAPKMTEAQRDLLGAVPEATTIYNLTSHEYQYHNGTTWLAF